MWLEISLALGILCYLFYRWMTANDDFFSKRGIPYKKPLILFGNMKDVLLRKVPFFDVINDVYNETDAKIYGIFEQRRPLFMIRDPDVIKQITIKHFDHFVNRREMFPYIENDLFTNGLFQLRDSKWRDMRNTLTPFFTGRKLRHMFEFMLIVVQNSIEYLKRQSAVDSSIALELNSKDFFSRYANDIIATTAFGLQINSFEEQNNQFFVLGKEVTTFDFWLNMKFILFFTCRPILKMLRIPLFSRKHTDYFMRLVLNTMNDRLKHNITRSDMIQMLLEARGLVPTEQPKVVKHDWSDVDAVAQCFVFFFAGFDSTSTLLCFATHELMENPDVQEKLYEEIQQTEQNLCSRPIDYDTIQSMSYLDMVIAETLRKWPAVGFIDRTCNKNIELDLGEGKTLTLKEGDIAWIPVIALHSDAKYFPNPQKFIPERFAENSTENTVTPYTYFPFGSGPRSCVGNRFALLELKAMLYYLVRDFHIEPSPKSAVPMKLSAKSFQIVPEKGFWLNLRLRQKN